MSPQPNTRLTGARRNAGLTQKELGDRAGLSQRLVSSIETGIQGGSVNTLTKLAKVLGVSLTYLTAEMPPAPEEGLSRHGVAEDPHLPPGLRDLARRVVLCESLAVEPEEWEALRSLESPRVLGWETYLGILLLIRSGVKVD